MGADPAYPIDYSWIASIPGNPRRASLYQQLEHCTYGLFRRSCDHNLRDDSSIVETASPTRVLLSIKTTFISSANENYYADLQETECLQCRALLHDAVRAREPIWRQIRQRTVFPMFRRRIYLCASLLRV